MKRGYLQIFLAAVLFLLALGLTGPAIGQTLDRLLEQVVEESLPNDREALLTAAKVWNSKL